MKRAKKLRERYARWRLLNIDELGKVINLLIGVGIAIIGYQMSFLTNEGYDYKGQRLESFFHY